MLVSAAENMDESFYNTSNAMLLNSFDFISVREEELQKHLQNSLLEKKIVKVLDPTLMAGAKYFEELIKNEKAFKRPYLLIYQVIRSKDFLIQEYAKQLSIQNGWDIVEIKNTKLYVRSNGKLSISNEFINPTKYVSLFKHAQFVLTTSFHGTAFSLLFNRPFNVISVSKAVDSRAKDLLIQLDIEDRLITLPINSTISEIDWEETNKKLSELRVPSCDFLKEALK